MNFMINFCVHVDDEFSLSRCHMLVYSIVCSIYIAITARHVADSYLSFLSTAAVARRSDGVDPIEGGS